MNKWEKRDRKVNKKRDSKKLSKPFRQLDRDESTNKKANKLRLRLAKRAKADSHKTEDIVEE